MWKDDVFAYGVEDALRMFGGFFTSLSSSPEPFHFASSRMHCDIPHFLIHPAVLLLSFRSFYYIPICYHRRLLTVLDLSTIQVSHSHPHLHLVLSRTRMHSLTSYTYLVHISR
jgi:hypothetical protein